MASSSILQLLGLPLWRSETCYTEQTTGSKKPFILHKPSAIESIKSGHLHHDIDQFDDKHLRRERQSVSLILGEETPFPVRRSKMASGYETPPGGVYID